MNLRPVATTQITLLGVMTTGWSGLHAVHHDEQPRANARTVTMSHGVVEITFKGEASPSLAEAFDCLGVTADRGVTQLFLAAGDQAALHGVLQQIRHLGLELISVRTTAPTAQPT